MISKINKHGGKRPNAGRKKKSPTATISARGDKQLISRFKAKYPQHGKRVIELIEGDLF